MAGLEGSLLFFVQLIGTQPHLPPYRGLWRGRYHMLSLCTGLDLLECLRKLIGIVALLLLLCVQRTEFTLHQSAQLQLYLDLRAYLQTCKILLRFFPLPYLGQHYCYLITHSHSLINNDQSTIIIIQISKDKHNLSSMPYVHNRKIRHHSQFREARENTQQNHSQNVLEKLPQVKMKRLLTKIGASQELQTFMQPPSHEKREQLSRVKLDQLRKEYFPQKQGKQAFEGDLDELVIDCWKPGFNSKKAVWKKYRQHHNDLTYKTIKIIMKK